jgi:taurine dioxygenase
MSFQLETRAISEAGGVEVVDFDASLRPEAEARIALRTALDEHRLLLFRDQSLDADAQVELLELFGTPLVENDNGQHFQYISNTRLDGILGDGRFAFHSDHAFMQDPIDVISLYASEIAVGCGRTHFIDGVRAASELPEPLQARVGELRARHIIDPEGDSKTVVARGARLSEQLPHAFHPILWAHPRTREPILYVSEQQTDSVESLGEAEGAALLEDLFAHLYSSPLVYVHEWREGDLIIFDNRALQHARDAPGSEAPRTLRRVVVGGSSVIEFFRMQDGRVVGSNRDAR